MAKPPVFEEPADILEALTEPLPGPKTTGAADSAETGAATEQLQDEARTDTLKRAPQSTRHVAGQKKPQDDAEQLEDAQRAGAASPDERDQEAHYKPKGPTPKRRSPNVSLYLSGPQKRELMKLKIDLQMDYTAIVVDALRARHPHRRWGS